ATPQEGARQVGMTARQYEPVPASSAVFNERFSLYGRIAGALEPHWPDIEKLARPDTGGSA
ncbi:carbohydrate kinase, partial [Mesorhizobium sp. M7A.F.Ca.CA.002.05.1.1]